MEEPAEKADWLAFGLQFIFGLLVGCVVGIASIRRRRHGIWLQDELILPYLAGAALIGAGLGALLGDRLWMGSFYRVLPPDAPAHSKTSQVVAIATIVLGAALAGHTLFRHFY
jgi:hypothetical protein